MIQEIRNRIAHGELGNRKLSVLTKFYPLVAWAFADIINILAPVCKRYSLAYVDSILASSQGLEATALQFVGTNGPLRVAYRAQTIEQHDRKRFEYLRLYCIRRGTEISDDRAVELSADDYLDMTPLLISNLAQPSQRRKSSIYGLEEYREGRYFRFLDLSFAETKITVKGEAPSEDPPAKEGTALSPFELLEFQYEANRLLADARRASRAVRSKVSQAGIDLSSVRESLWDISQSQSGGILDVSRYGAFGQVVGPRALEQGSFAFDAALFVEPPQGHDVRAFLTSQQRAMVLVGRSGFGKSNLLTYFFLQHLQASRLAVFLAGRQFTTSDIRDAIETNIAKMIDYDWKFKNLTRFLEKNNNDLTIFVDAINEYSGTGGPVALLKSLVNLSASESALGRCRVVATCRIEPWTQYRQEDPRPLDRKRFYATATGDAINVSGFDNEQMRNEVFTKYARYHDLQPSAYADLTPSVRELFAQPLLLSLICEIYSNRNKAAGDELRAIPKTLDYFTIFDLLTARKGIDARKMVPSSDELRQATIEDDLREFLQLFSEKVFDRVVAASGASDGDGHVDAIPLDAVNKDIPMQPYVRPREGEGPFTVLSAARQLGLVDIVELAERGGQAHQKGRAYKLFHDQYTQYWLADFYRRIRLGSIEPALRDGGEVEREALADKIRDIIALSRNAPVLAGGLEHWFHRNLIEQDGRIECLIPIANSLAQSESGDVRYYAASILTTFVAQGAVTPKVLYNAAFSKGSLELKTGLAEAFVDFWPGLGAEVVRELLNACKADQDELAIEALADVFAEFVNSERHDADGAIVIGFVADIFPDLLTVVTRFRGLDPLKNHANFLIRFCLMVIVTCADRPQVLLTLRNILGSRFHLLLDSLLGRKTGNLLVDLVPGKQTFFRKLLNGACMGRGKMQFHAMA